MGDVFLDDHDDSHHHGDDNESIAQRSEMGQSMMTYRTSDGDNRRNLQKKEEDMKMPEVAKREQQMVMRSRIVTFLMLLVALIIMATLTHSLVTENEKKEFEIAFQNYASEIASVVEQNAHNTLQVVEAFSATISSYATATSSPWPFVMIPDFTGRAKRLADITHAKTVTFTPFVSAENRTQWFQYSNENKPLFYQDALRVEKSLAKEGWTVERLMAESSPYIWTLDITDPNLPYQVESRPGPYLVNWQTYPLIYLDFPPTNYNILTDPRIIGTVYTTHATNQPSLDFAAVPKGNVQGIPAEEWEWTIDSQLIQPIFLEMDHDPEDDEVAKNKVMVGAVVLTMDWVSYFDNLLPPDIKGIQLVLSSSCGTDKLTVEINGLETKPIGMGDLHSKGYDQYRFFSPFVQVQYNTTTSTTTAQEGVASSSAANAEDICSPELYMELYPTKEFEESFYTNNATYYTIFVVGIFVVTSLIFFVYDFTVRRRQSKVMARIVKQHKIVANVFPTNIRNRLLGDDSLEDHLDQSESNMTSGGGDGDGDDKRKSKKKSAPLAELYPHVTVLFADITHFSAWSSAREPPQVFQLLETIYGSFDKIAYRHGVFKVETVGDCYVACAGLPEPQNDHAIRIAKFARDCVHKMTDLTHTLEMTLGPDTTDLKLRVGIHTGQVTAGVLRGERSRFQLFGTSVNTAARMENTSSSSRIQVSSSTAKEIQKWKRGKWLSPRHDTVSVQGMGDMQTYWLETREEAINKKTNNKNTANTMEPVLEESHPEAGAAKVADNDEEESEEDEWVDDLVDDMSGNDRHRHMTKTERLVEWNIEVLKQLLKQIIASRDASIPCTRDGIKGLARAEANLMSTVQENTTDVLGEFKEIISMQRKTGSLHRISQSRDPDSIVIPEVVISQLRDLLSLVAGMYRDNAFHNFEHASHVTASVRKLLTRIVKANQTSATGDNPENETAPRLVDRAGHSFGITSDPLTQFAVVFSAIIHDADHPGVPNATLLKEGTSIAKIYKKSIAEQNSVDLVWHLLMSDKYADLRACIYSSEEELRRFRQLVVNTVMATDIVDKELQALRKARWATAFSDTHVDSTVELDMNRKATIVIEHLIQASDVSHTMQHWHIYRDWNERFFFELYGAYRAGRADSDPSVGWYKGEIGFFDFYIIPLAKKLESCGVFGVSSHEYLSYATANRDEWAREGEKIVQEYVRKFDALHPSGVEQVDSNKFNDGDLDSVDC